MRSTAGQSRSAPATTGRCGCRNSQRAAPLTGHDGVGSYSRRVLDLPAVASPLPASSQHGRQNSLPHASLARATTTTPKTKRIVDDDRCSMRLWKFDTNSPTPAGNPAAAEHRPQQHHRLPYRYPPSRRFHNQWRARPALTPNSNRQLISYPTLAIVRANVNEHRARMRPRPAQHGRSR